MFKKNTEDFECENCHVAVKGDGYTNHCPNCLYSKHVDVEPGDRMALCKGIMQPVWIEGIDGKYKITHSCRKCGHKKVNKVSDKDNFDVVAKIAKERNPDLLK